MQKVRGGLARLPDVANLERYYYVQKAPLQENGSISIKEVFPFIGLSLGIFIGSYLLSKSDS